jgi:hypothetical protein
MLRGWVLATAAVALFPSLAHADSDGYYCIGPGFVAYEMSFSGAASGHWLHIVRVSASKGIVRLPPIALPEFQVHGMTCRENAVDLDGWTTRHSVALDSNGQATVTSTAVEPSPKGAHQQNLAMGGRAGVTDILSDGFRGEFQLVIAEVVRAMPRGAERYTVSQIWRRAPAAPITRQVTAAETLFVGVGPSEGGQ